MPSNRKKSNVEGVERVSEKGFIFSVDSIGAIAIVIALGVVWILFVHYETGMRTTQMNKSTQDNALVSLYTGVPENDSLNTSKEFALCKKYFAYDDATNSVIEYMHCEEAE